MYKLLLVDDERIIREGIAKLVPWSTIDIDFIGTANNGKEAYDIILNNPPQIVITDIKMPLMDGIELLEEVKKLYKDTVFIILTSYGEFSYAQKAMLQGVKHYLLKPCNETKIIEVITQVKEEIQLEQSRREFIKNSKLNLDNFTPLVKEQFFRNYSLNKKYTLEEYDYFKKLLGVENDSLRLLLLQTKNECNLEEISITADFLINELERAIILAHTIIKNQVLFLITDVPFEIMINFLSSMKLNYENYYETEFNFVITSLGKFIDIPKMYKIAQDYIQKGVYIEDMNTLTSSEIKVLQETYSNMVEKHSKLVSTIKKLVNNNINNPELSLKWLANNFIFMNVGYLSREFNKKTGEKFSHYLNRIRMEKSMKLIIESDEDKIYEVAEKIGYGDNPQYFSQLFKKHTGLSPTEFKRKR